MRPSWHKYFTQIAQTVSERATCNRLKVGCVVVSPDNRILTTGYNGSLSGQPHCDEDDHYMVDGHCVRTNHAEANAVAQAARAGVSLWGATAYVTHTPCLPCARLLYSSGVSKIIFSTHYPTEDKSHENIILIGDITGRTPRLH